VSPADPLEVVQRVLQVLEDGKYTAV